MNVEPPMQQIRRELSKRLYPLGDRCPQIWQEFDEAGFRQASLDRNIVLSLAENEAAREQIPNYWVEYAKERIAGLVGPMDVSRGELPEISAYRSELLDRLREIRRQEILKTTEPHSSPQIEPTLRRFDGIFYTDPFKVNRLEQLNHQCAVEINVFMFSEIPGFYYVAPQRRYELMVGRYAVGFEPHGFLPDLGIKGGSVFRKPIPGTSWDMLFVDESRRSSGVDAWVGITTQGRRVQPGSNRVITMLGHFPIRDLIPGFIVYTSFRPQSFAEMCLTCAANACATGIIFRHISELLAR